MFTWRYTKWWKGFNDISDLYHENIIKLLEDPDLLEALKQKNKCIFVYIVMLTENIFQDM